MKEFANFIQQYELRLGESLSHITLSGGVAAFPGMEGYVSNLLMQENVEIGNPFSLKRFAQYS